MDTISPDLLPTSQSCTWSQVEDAAEAADDSLRAAIIAPPLLAIVVMNSPSYHFWSFTFFTAYSPPTLAEVRSGYWVREWLPQMTMFLMEGTEAPVLSATYAMALF